MLCSVAMPADYEVPAFHRPAPVRRPASLIVREAEQVVVGTVKVRNLAFHKEVLVRSTSDDWATHEDAYCTYVNNGPCAAGVPVLYDTFSFRLALPPQSRKLEFCVRFRAEGHSQDFWDSNGGKNYVLLKKSSPHNPVPQLQYTSPTVDELTSKIGGLAVHHIRPMSPPKQNDIYAKVDSWSEFASWDHLSMDGPYW